jgi:hypothetical protein
MTWTPRVCGEFVHSETNIDSYLDRNGIYVVILHGPLWLADQAGNLTEDATKLFKVLGEEFFPILLVIDSDGGEVRSANFLGDILEKAGASIAVHLVRARGSALLAAIECPVRFGQTDSVIGDLREYMSGEQVPADIDPKYVNARCHRRVSSTAFEAMANDGMTFAGEMAEAYGLVGHLSSSIQGTIKILQGRIRNMRFDV